MNDVIPFGKYRGQEIAQVIQRDPQYVQWLMQQAWFSEKFAPIYQLVVNNFAPPSEETPAHNALQVRFLDFDFQKTFWFVACFHKPDFEWPALQARFERDGAYVRKAPSPMRSHLRRSPEHVRDHKDKIRSAWKVWRRRNECDQGRTFYAPQFEEISDVNFYIDGWVGFPKDLDLKQYNCTERLRVFIEIKPTMGDDYPAVLRQIKRQQNNVDHESYGYGAVKDRWCLLLEQFASAVVTLDQVRKIFSRDDIAIVMLEDVRNALIAAGRTS